MGRFSLGIDFGSNSARALIVDIDTGEEFGIGTSNYKGGEQGVYLDASNPHLARQNPESYVKSMVKCVKEALKLATTKPGFSPEEIVGIGVDTTGSTPLPVDSTMTPLASTDRFKNNLNAYAWMWKDHTGMEEAEKITETAARMRPQYLAKCGGTYSSEWFFSKVWHCLNADPEVFNAAESWVEFCDFIPAVLAGIKKPSQIKRSVCAAGHKAMFCTEWGGLPDREFLSALSPGLAGLPEKLYSTAYTSDQVAGNLSKKWAKKLGLKEGTPIAVGAFDAHFGAVGAGISSGKLVKIIGTSTCDMMVAPPSVKVQDIPGVCGIVDGSILPGCYAIEAGQSAVGDIFNWFVSYLCEDSHKRFAKLNEEATQLRPGESGLLALDWNNGNRTILVDPKLSGLIMGMTLHSSQADIYRALIEATAFGARRIIDRIGEHKVEINEIINCGGIAEKNPLFMQIYADVIGKPMKVTASAQTCALGSAMFGAVAGGAYKKVEEMQEKICRFKDKVFQPIPENTAVYNELYRLYCELHDSFGVRGKTFDHYGLMKKLLEISSKNKSK